MGHLEGLTRGEIPSKLKFSEGHLDNEFRNKFKYFVLENNTYFDSREIYWRNITQWNKLKKIIVSVKGNVTIFDKPHDGFLMLSHQYINPTFTEWCCGYIKGDKCYLTDINWRNGRVERETIVPIQEMKNHVHDSLKKKLKL